MSVQTVIQQTVVDDIQSIVMTDIAQDPDTSNYIREFRLFDTNGVQQFTLRCISTSRTALELTAPAQQF